MVVCRCKMGWYCLREGGVWYKKVMSLDNPRRPFLPEIKPKRNENKPPQRFRRVNGVFLGPETSKKDDIVPPLSADTIPYFSHSLLLDELEKKNAENWIPSLNEMKALVCNCMNNTLQVDTALLPWPVPYDTTRKRYYSTAKYDRNLDNNDVVYGIRKVIKNASPENRNKLVEYMFDNWESFSNGDVDELNMLFSSILYITELDIPTSKKITEYVIKELQNRAEQKKDPDYDDRLGEIDFKFMFMIENVHWHYKNLCMPAILGNVFSAEEIKIITGHVLESIGPAETLNSLRESLKTSAQGSVEHTEAEKLIKKIMGFDESTSNVNIYKSLTDLYRAIKFENYIISKETEKFRIDMLLSILKEKGIEPDASIVDLGSGTGWLVNGLRKAESGYTNVTGIDFSEENVAKAINLFGEYFKIGNWYTLEKHIQEPVDAILSLGRSLPHTETKYNFDNVLKQVYTVLKTDGLFIFDMPDPSRGNYAIQVDNFRKVMKNFNVSDHTTKYEDTIIDSPNGVDFYNRYVPSEETIRILLRVYGFDLKEVIYEDIPTAKIAENGEKDRNMVFVCRKVEKTDPFANLQRIVADLEATSNSSTSNQTTI